MKDNAAAVWTVGDAIWNSFEGNAANNEEESDAMMQMRWQEAGRRAGRRAGGEREKEGTV